MLEKFIEKVFDEKNQEIDKLRTSLAAKELLITDLKKKIVDLKQEVDYQTCRAEYYSRGQVYLNEKLEPTITPTPEEPTEELDILSQHLIKTGRGFLAAKKKS